MTGNCKIAKRQRAVVLVTRKAQLLDLPVEVLSRVFASLCPASLRSIRLVCRAFRTASLSHIQLSVSTTCLSTARRQLKMLPPSATVSAELHSVHATALACFRTLKPKICKLLICAACDALGCETQAVIQPERFGASRQFALFTAQLAQATRITSLWLNRCEALAAPLVAACPQLQELTVFGRTYQKAFPRQSQLLGALQKASGLQSLFLSGHCNWRQLLPTLAGLPKLHSLAMVSVMDEATVTMVAELTQLTKLEMALDAPEELVITGAHLSRIIYLQILHVTLPPWRTEQFSQALRGLHYLQHLALHVVKTVRFTCIAPFTAGAADRTRLVSAMLQPPLSYLIWIQLECVLSPSDACVVARALPASVRRLLLILGRDESPVQAQPAFGGHSVQPGDHSRAAAAALAPILPRLESLELGLLTQEVWAAFAPNLGACVGLKYLALRGPSAAVVESLPLGPCLSSMKHLIHLVLASALDIRVAATDIPCIAQLTALQNLQILSWRAPSGLSGERPRASVAALVRNVDLLPLAGLRMLRWCHIHSMRRMRGGGTRESAFKKRLHELQWAMGLPLADVVDVALNKGPANVWYSSPCDGFDG